MMAQQRSEPRVARFGFSDSKRIFPASTTIARRSVKNHPDVMRELTGNPSAMMAVTTSNPGTRQGCSARLSRPRHRSD